MIGQAFLVCAGVTVFPRHGVRLPWYTEQASMLTARRWKMLQTIARQSFAGGEPDAGQGFHAGDEPVQHRRPKGATGNEGMQANVQITALLVEVLEGIPPDLEHALRVGQALPLRSTANPAKIEKHGVVNGVVEGQI